MPDKGVKVQILSWAPVRASQGRLAQLEERHVYTVDVRGSSPLSPTGADVRSTTHAKVAQLVELTTENRAVGSSSLPLGTETRAGSEDPARSAFPDA